VTATKIVVVSDAHPGDPRSSFERHAIQRAAIEAMADEGPVDELVLLGDALDLDYGTLPIAVEGRVEEGGGRGAGLRSFLHDACRDTGVRRVAYVPGNHDYWVFDVLASHADEIGPLDAGQTLDYEPMFSGCFATPFLRGLMPGGRRDDLVVHYPNRTIELAGYTVLLTHGHHLDPTQALFMSLDDVVRAANPRRARQAFLSDVAGYQTIAHAISYGGRTRRIAYVWAGGLGRLFRRVASLRGKEMGAQLRRAIDIYITLFADEPPDVLVFGHTHVPGHWRLRAPRRAGDRRRALAVYNSGGFVDVHGAAGTFLVFRAEGEHTVTVDEVVIAESGQWERRRLPSP
jgi:predicted phosphodiesterase